MVKNANHARGLGAEDARRIGHALDEVSARTSVRIVVAVAEASGRYDRPEDIAGFLLGLLGAALVWVVLPDAQPGNDSWAGFTTGAKLMWMLATLVSGFVLGALLAARWWVLRRIFTPRLEMRDCVDRSAAAAYHTLLGVKDAGDGAGLLVYLSLYERRATLLTDATVEQAIGQATLDTLLRDLTLLLRDDDPAEAVCQTVRRAAAACAEAFPADPSISNDANALVLV